MNDESMRGSWQKSETAPKIKSEHVAAHATRSDQDSAEIELRSEDVMHYALRLGDDALIHCQRLTAWVRCAPTIELDLALANFSLDLLGQARLFLSYAGDIVNNDRDEDDFAFLRTDQEFTNLLMLELPNGDFSFTMLRFYFHALFCHLIYSELVRSKEHRLADIAAKAEKETRYHVAHAGEWVVRMGDGTEESHQRLSRSLGELWPYTGEMFESDALAQTVQAAGVGVDPARVSPAWHEQVRQLLARAAIAVPEHTWRPTGGRNGVHSEHLSYLLAEMQVLPRSYPGCRW